MSEKELRKLASKLAGSGKNFVSRYERAEHVKGIIKGIKYAKGIKSSTQVKQGEPPIDTNKIEKFVEDYFKGNPDTFHSHESTAMPYAYRSVKEPATTINLKHYFADAIEEYLIQNSASFSQVNKTAEPEKMTDSASTVKEEEETDKRYVDNFLSDAWIENEMAKVRSVRGSAMALRGGIWMANFLSSRGMLKCSSQYPAAPVKDEGFEKWLEGEISYLENAESEGDRYARQTYKNVLNKYRSLQREEQGKGGRNG